MRSGGGRFVFVQRELACRVVDSVEGVQAPLVQTKLDVSAVKSCIIAFTMSGMTINLFFSHYVYTLFNAHIEKNLDGITNNANSYLTCQM